MLGRFTAGPQDAHRRWKGRGNDRHDIHAQRRGPAETSGRKRSSATASGARSARTGRSAPSTPRRRPGARRARRSAGARRSSRCTFRVAMANKQVTDLKADGERGDEGAAPTKREMNADHSSSISIRPRTRPRTRRLDGDVQATTIRRTRATAVRANYDIPNDKVVLTARCPASIRRSSRTGRR